MFITSYYFPKRTMSKYILVIAFIFFFYNFMMILIIPLDIYYTYNKEEEGKKQEELFKKIEKRLNNIYDMNFTILLYGNKTLITFLIGYIKSGEFYKSKKIFNGVLNVAIQMILLVVIIPMVLLPLVKVFNFLGLLFIIFQIYNLVYAYMYIGVTIVKLPQQLYLLADIDKSIDYYQFKTHKKIVTIKNNNDKVIEYLHQCKLTMEFIKKKEENGIYNDVEEIDNEKKEEESNDNIINDIGNDIKTDKNKKKDKKKKIKVKELINNKILLDLLESHINEIIKSNEIDYDEKENEKIDKDIMIFLNKSEIIKANEKLKCIERDNEKHNNDITDYYKKWNYYKTLKINSKILFKNDIEEQFNEGDEDFIPSQALSKTKLSHLIKCHKTYYIVLMILSIIVGIIIILSENTLKFKENISAFGILFKKGLLSYLVYFIYVICLFFYSTYSTKFTRLKLFGETFKLSPKNKTNTISFLSFIGNLSDFSGAVCTNIVKILKHGKTDLKTIIEEKGSSYIKSAGLNIIQQYVSLIIVIFVIITYFKVAEKICKKKTGVQFHIDSEERNKYINEGKDYLMELNKAYLGEYRLLE